MVCTGNTIDGSLQHDGDTCPIHEAPGGRIFACLSVQGTAMSEAAICGVCVKDERLVSHIIHMAQLSGDWGGDVPKDCTGNTELFCHLCGATGGQ